MHFVVTHNITTKNQMILSIYTTPALAAQTADIEQRLRTVRNLHIIRVDLATSPDSYYFLNSQGILPEQLPAVFLGVHQITDISTLLAIKFPVDLPESAPNMDNSVNRILDRIIRKQLRLPKTIRSK